MVVLFGRRRVGKTFLIHHFLSQLPIEVRRIYLAASRRPYAAEVASFAEACDSEGLTLDTPSSWTDALDQIVDLAVDQTVVDALDEVPYFMETSRSFAAELQRSWDRARHLGRPVRLLVVLTGSALSTMRELNRAREPSTLDRIARSGWTRSPFTRRPATWKSTVRTP